MIIGGLLRVYLHIDNSISHQTAKSFLKKTNYASFLTFGAAFSYLILIFRFAFKEVDLIEKFKLYFYFIPFIICIFAGIIGDIFKKDNSLTLTIQYGLITLLSFLMIYYHWPSKSKRVLVYDQQKF